MAWSVPRSSRCGWELLLSGIGNPHDAAKLNVASSLCELLEAKFAQDLQDFSSREDSQL
jgi:hypothetical protein